MTPVESPIRALLMRLQNQIRSHPTAALAAVAASSSALIGAALAQRGLKVAFAAMAVASVALVVVTFPRRVMLALAAIFLVFAVPANISFGPSAALAWRVVILAALAYAAAGLLVGQPLIGAGKWTIQDRLVGCYLSVAIASWFIRAPGLSWEIVVLAVSPFAVYGMARTLSPESLHIVLWTALIAATAGALTVLIELASGQIIFSGIDASQYAWRRTGQLAFRPGGVFGSPPAAAAALLSATLACAPLCARGARYAPLARACGILLLLGGLATFTRAPQLGFLAGAAILISLNGANAKRTVTLVIAIAATGLIASAAAGPLIASGFNRVNDTFATRQGFWASSLPLITASPGTMALGYGPLNLSSRKAAGQTLPAELGVSDLAIWSVHNRFLEEAINTGLIGASLFIAWLVGCAIAGIRIAMMGRTTRPPPLASGLGPAIIVYVGALSASTLTSAGDLYPLALWAGLAVAMDRHLRETAARNRYRP